MSDPSTPGSPDVRPSEPPPETSSPQPEHAAQHAPPQPEAGYAMVPPKPRGGFGQGFGKGLGFALGFGVVALVALLLGFVLVLVSMGSLLASSNEDGSTTQLATIWGDEAAGSSLRAIDISGTIMADGGDGALLSAGTYGYEVADMLDELTAEDSSGVVLLVNTPGGSVGGSRAIADAVERYRERTGQPVLVHVTEMSASGGVYATSTADEILADHGALVGSIGIISGPYEHYSDVTALGSTILTPGVEAGSITQEYLSMGEGKDFGNPFREMTDAERQQWMEMLGFEYDNFVAQVSEHRGIDEATIRDEMGAGIFANDRAQEYGLIDGVLGRDEFFRHAAETAGLDPEDTRVETVTMPQGFLSSFLGIERAYGKSPVVEQGPGVTPALSPAICAPGTILAHHGPTTSACG